MQPKRKACPVADLTRVKKSDPNRSGLVIAGEPRTLAELSSENNRDQGTVHDNTVAARCQFHSALKTRVLWLKSNVLVNADPDNELSNEIAVRLEKKIEPKIPPRAIGRQTACNNFVIAIAEFLRESMPKRTAVGRSVEPLSRFHRPYEVRAVGPTHKSKMLATLLEDECVIKSDILILRDPAQREKSNPSTYAGIACKLTIRNHRSESAFVNLIRTWPRTTPLAFVVTGEPLPSRLSAIALGGGDIDCVYHFALPELIDTVKELDLPDSEEALKIMIDGKRLKDIADLPLDLAV